MCGSPPGTHCPTDTRARAVLTQQAYDEAHPNKLAVDAL